ncbi:transcriptional regulator, IclR family [Actinopolyspora alba]|uniref:Transcriptional regulator, IclR family n=2 Tax=Actinopolyspora alba TaxID=673379 RepID=A0A1I1U0R8_9ACTN|nr:transcriptional regulator, IclR family [Actinopolyspora alba]
MRRDMTESPGEPLRKAFVVLEEISGSSKPLTLSEISQRVDFPKSTLHRLMRVLTDIGAVVRLETKAYELGDYFSRLSAVRGKSRVEEFSEAITPHLIDLFRRVHCVVSVGMLSGARVRYAGTLYNREDSRIARTFRHPVPVHRSAVGRLLLAGSSRDWVEFHEASSAVCVRGAMTNPSRIKREFELIGRTGVSCLRSEHNPELVEMAAPVFLGGEAPSAAVAVAGTVSRTNLRTVTRTLLETVGAITDNLAEAG